MSVVDKLKKMHPAYWVLGLGGVALGVDYYVERDKSVASSIYRKLSGQPEPAGALGAGPGGGIARLLRPGVVLPSTYGPAEVFYPAFPPGHPHRHHWLFERPLFDRAFRGPGFGREHGFYGRGPGWYGHHGGW